MYVSIGPIKCYFNVLLHNLLWLIKALIFLTITLDWTIKLEIGSVKMIGDWIAFIILSGIAICFMFQGEGAIEKYFQKQTTYTVSHKLIKELPTLLLCFNLKVERDYDIFGKDLKIWYGGGVISSTHR